MIRFIGGSLGLVHGAGRGGGPAGGADRADSVVGAVRPQILHSIPLTRRTAVRGVEESLEPQVCEGASYLWVQRVEESSKKRRLAPGGRPHDTATLLPRSLGGPCSHYPVLHHPAPTTLWHPVNPSKPHRPIGRINQLVVQVRLPSLMAGSVFPILGQMCRASRPTWHLHPFLPISVPGVAR